MAQIILFHHALGLTDGVRALADQIAAGGHTVHTPDLYDGRTFATVDEGVAHAQQIGFEEIGRRGMRACAQHQEASVVAGISMGVMPAWRVAQVVPGFRACIAMAGAEALDAYAPLADHWAANGFVVVQPTHLDSRTLAIPQDDPRTPHIWRHRIADLVRALDGDHRCARRRRGAGLDLQPGLVDRLAEGRER